MRKLLLALVPIIALFGHMEAANGWIFDIGNGNGGQEETTPSVHHVVHHRHSHRHRSHVRPKSNHSGEWLRRQVHPDPGVQYNRAEQWLHWGRYTDGPGLGTVGVLPDQVFVVIKVLELHKVEAATSSDGQHIKVIITHTDKVLGWRAPPYLTLLPNDLLW